MVLVSYDMSADIKNTGDITLNGVLVSYIYNAQTGDTHSHPDSVVEIEPGFTHTHWWTLRNVDLSIGDWVGVVQVWNADKSKKLAEANTGQWGRSMPVSGRLAAEITNMTITKVGTTGVKTIVNELPDWAKIAIPLVGVAGLLYFATRK